MMKKKNPIYGDSLMVERNNSLFFCTPISLYAISMELFLLEHLSFCKGNSSFSGLKLWFPRLETFGLPMRNYSFISLKL